MSSEPTATLVAYQETLRTLRELDRRMHDSSKSNIL